jgi:hypothetical protein
VIASPSSHRLSLGEAGHDYAKMQLIFLELPPKLGDVPERPRELEQSINAAGPAEDESPTSWPTDVP